MAHHSQSPMAADIIERATAVSLGEAQETHPLVLSCGGVFLPRPKRPNPRDPLYYMLHTPTAEFSTKIVSACAKHGILEVALGREYLN